MQFIYRVEPGKGDPLGIFQINLHRASNITNPLRAAWVYSAGEFRCMGDGTDCTIGFIEPGEGTGSVEISGNKKIDENVEKDKKIDKNVEEKVDKKIDEKKETQKTQKKICL